MTIQNILPSQLHPLGKHSHNMGLIFSEHQHLPAEALVDTFVFATFLSRFSALFILHIFQSLHLFFGGWGGVHGVSRHIIFMLCTAAANRLRRPSFKKQNKTKASPVCLQSRSSRSDGLPFNAIPVTVCLPLLMFNKHAQIGTGFTAAIRGRMLSA